jgi:AraC-like DNA-binding protein
VRSISRTPRPPLRPFVQTVWAFDSEGAPAGVGGGRERVLPTGHMHLVVRLSPDPLRLYADEDAATGEDVGCAVIGGARGRYYVRDVSAPSRSVGAQLLPGAAVLLFGAPAIDLAERHTSLDDVWGREAERLRDRLAAAPTLDAALDALEVALAARLPRVRAIHPAVAHALAAFGAGPTPVAQVVEDTGYSHRRFVELFRHDVGLAPKQYCRVGRMRRALDGLAGHAPIADVAFAAGYADQAHLTRDLRELAGVPPSEVRALGATSHLAIRR